MDKSPQGFNPLRWDCEKKGCFNKLRRPKIEVFFDCFPGRINFGDIDGMVEINGRGLMLEWKSAMGQLTFPTGQRIMYEKLTEGTKITVLAIIGNPETMVCQKYCVFFDGKQTGWANSDLECIKKRIKKWVSWAKAH